MKFLKTRCSACLLVLLVLLSASCRKNQSSNWNTQLLVPIVSTTLSLQNLVSDSSSLRANKDSSLTLAFQSSLYQFTLADKIVQIPDTNIGQRFTLDSLTLPNIGLNFITSLGGMAHQIGPPVGQYIISIDSTTTAVPAFSIPTAFQYGFNASGYFDSARLTGGDAVIWAVNELPVAVAAGTLCVLTDSISGRVIQSKVFPRIPSHDSVYVTFGLIPGLITSHLMFTISNLTTEASNGAVFVDTSDKIILRVTIHNLHVSEAWAKFPNQSVVDQTNDITFNLADRKFTYVEALSGLLHVQISNAVPQPLKLRYTLVGAYNKLGQPLVEYTRVPEAVNGVPAVIDTVLDVTGYSINLTGSNGSSFNTYTQRVSCALDSTGETQHITLQDSLSVKYELTKIKPKYVKGYMGRDTLTNADSTAFDFLSIFKSGTINLQSVNMNFSVENDIGIDGQITVNALTAVSPNNGSKPLTGALLHQPLSIKRATDFPLTPAISNFALNNGNSDIGQMLGILPNKLNYNISVKTNVHGNNNQYRDFAYLQSGIKVGLNAEIPLSLIANNLVLRDTIGFNLANTNTNVNGISDGIINIIAENKYPIEAILTVIVYDANWRPVDTLALNKTITAANTDANCRARQATQSVLQEYVDNNRVNKLKQGNYAVITANFSTTAYNTTCNGQYFKIYSDYTIGLTLAAKFNYKVVTKL